MGALIAVIHTWAFSYIDNFLLKAPSREILDRHCPGPYSDSAPPRVDSQHVDVLPKVVSESAGYHHKSQTHGLQGATSVSGTKDPNRDKTDSKDVSQTPEIEIVHIPTSMKSATFLKHPDLTMGQKQYLCSIARVYSTTNMRTLTDHHLHSQRRFGSAKKQFKHSTHSEEEYQRRLEIKTKSRCKLGDTK
ncbi:protein FAM216A [Rhinophrynus dorsalis]